MVTRRTAIESRPPVKILGQSEFTGIIQVDGRPTSSSATSKTGHANQCANSSKVATNVINPLAGSRCFTLKMRSIACSFEIEQLIPQTPSVGIADTPPASNKRTCLARSFTKIIYDPIRLPVHHKRQMLFGLQQ